MGFLLLGVDSLIAGIAIGAIVDRRWRLPLAALFGVADAVVFLMAVGLGLRLSAGVTEVLEIMTLAALGLWLLVVAAGTQRAVAYWPVWALPLALTLDNFAYGLVGDHSAASLFGHAGEQALVSALLAFVGLTLAASLPRMLPVLERRAAAYRVAGAALLVATAGFVLLG